MFASRRIDGAQLSRTPLLVNARHRQLRWRNDMSQPPDVTASLQTPLAVDLDGTLIRTDMMWESLVRLLRKNPLAAFLSVFALLRGRAHFKQTVAAQIQVDPANLPYHEPLLAWLKQQKASGRKLVLATASDIGMAKPIADHVGLFDDVMASDGKTNLRNAAKRDALTKRFGERGYDYAGNSNDDLGVWPGTREAVVVNAASQNANALVAQVVPKYTELFSEANLQGFPGNRGQYQALAEEAKGLLNRASEQFRVSASKLEEAGNQAVPTILTEYWTLKVQSFRNLADSKDTFAKVIGLLVDETVTSSELLNEKLGPLIDEANKLREESEKLDAEAKKLQDANPDKFK